MMNQYGLDLGKTVFVIDSPITAFMVSILSEETNKSNAR